MTTKPPNSSAPAELRSGTVTADELRAYAEAVTDPIDRIRSFIQLALVEAIQAEVDRGSFNNLEVGLAIDAVADGVATAAFSFLQKTISSTSDSQHEFDKDFPIALGQFTNHLTHSFVHLIQMFSAPVEGATRQ